MRAKVFGASALLTAGLLLLAGAPEAWAQKKPRSEVPPVLVFEEAAGNCALPAQPPTRSTMAPGALERLRAEFDAKEAARNAQADPQRVIHDPGQVYARASMAGIAEAAFVLAQMRFRLAEDPTRDPLYRDQYAKGMEMLVRAAALGLADAQYALALKCATRSPDAAHPWMRRAAGQGHVQARQWLQDHL